LSRPNQSSNAIQLIEQAINELKLNFPQHSLTIGFSGGLDSTVLLHAIVQSGLWNHQSLQAIHIHHGLQASAEDWAKHCQTICQTLNVPFNRVDIKLPLIRRQGLEANARKARYQALYQAMPHHDLLLTAHHQRDQAETYLLALMRGAGPAGLASMPMSKLISKQNDQWHLRPLLKIPYSILQAYAQYYQLSWIEDPSNQQTHFKRNFVRHEILPKISQAWGAGEQNIAYSAKLQSEALGLLNDLAQMDLTSSEMNGLYFDYRDCLKLSNERLKNLFRVWFAEYLPIQINQMIYDWLLRMIKMETKKIPTLKLKQGELRVYDKKIYYLQEIKQDYQLILEEDTAQILQMPKYYFEPILKQMLNSSIEIRYEVRAISLAEQVQFKGLKKAFKKAKIPPWDRERWPMISFSGQNFTPLQITKYNQR